MLRSVAHTHFALSALRHTPRQAQWSRGLKGLVVGVPKETLPLERRVALVPGNVAKLIKAGAAVQVERGAGADSGFPDESYAQAGAALVDRDAAWRAALVAKVRPPSAEEARRVESRTLVSLLQPRLNGALVDALAAQGATALSLDSLLRTLSRGQAFDVLSSQASVAGQRAVLEAAHVLQRPFGGQTSAAGRVAPARVLVVGAGVAGLAAIQQAKKLGAVVVGFDARAAAKEQVESCGARFLAVLDSAAEDGAGAGGYAKQMSDEWFARAQALLRDECRTADVVITTAAVPGQRAPLLLNDEAVAALPAGAVVVDLAAAMGGNVAGTVKDQVVRKGGVTIVGFTDMESRMAATASTLFGGNVTNLLLAMRDKKTGEYALDLADDAVRSMCVVHAGEKLAPFTPPAPPTTASAANAAEKEKKREKDKAPLTEGEVRAQYLRRALFSSAGATAALGAAAAVPHASMVSTFALSCWVGLSSVRGVSHALHSPLMAMTNAVSGMTIVGGMLQLGGGVLPTTVPQTLAAAAVALSAVNLAGGTIVTKKMLDMFRRKDDPPEFNELFLLPSAAAVAGAAALVGTGALSAATVAPALGLFSALSCVGGISCLSSQRTARLGVSVGVGGIAAGLAATLLHMSPALQGGGGADVLLQLALLGGGGAAAGAALARRIGPTELPQAVAAFHSLVGVAAAATAVGDFAALAQAGAAHGDAFHSVATFLGAWMGGITAAGSAVAFGKLHGALSAAPLQWRGRDALNVALGGASLASLAAFATTGDPLVAGAALGVGLLSSGALGWHMTQSIGGADMPVVVTLLNSYSGWALCAEGFLLDQPLLTVVGALIGSSGAFLTQVMCEAMNRSLKNVILGGFGTAQTAPAAAKAVEARAHTEIDPAGSAELLKSAEKVVVVPGYGLAVAQASGIIADIALALRAQGKEVKFAVHPVAGRMPGQLNVMLAEAGIPYDMVHELGEINEEMSDFDVALIVGANDTVNSAAEDEESTSQLKGMPVIQAWKAKRTIFMKRSMAAGYAGVDNPVFYNSNNDMLLGDAKKTCEAIRAQILASK